MDGYRKQIEIELTINSDVEKQDDKSRVTLLEKLSYMVFTLNVGTCTLFSTLSNEKIDFKNISINSNLTSSISVLLWGALLIIFSFLLGYMSSACKAKYFSKLCKYEKCQLKNVLMFEDYVLGKRYCDMFSPYTEEQMYDSNLKLLQKNLVFYEQLKKVNKYNLRVSKCLEKASAAYCFLSLLFFLEGILVFQNQSLYIGGSFATSFWNFFNSDYMHLTILIFSFIYVIYQSFAKPFFYYNQKKKLSKKICQKSEGSGRL